MKLATCYRVLIGAPRATARYARAQGWRDDECLFVSTFESLRWGIDPVTVRNIIVLPGLPEDTTTAIEAELEVIKAVWPEIIISRNPTGLRARPRSHRRA